MRREKKKISLDVAEQLLLSSRRGILGVNGDDGYPYAVPINFYYDKDSKKIYFHGSSVGHKAESLSRSDKVCFTVYGNESIKDVAWAPYVQSVVAFGRCRRLDGDEEKMSKLKTLAEKYYPDDDTINKEIASSGKAARVFEIHIEHMTGKEIQER